MWCQSLASKEEGRRWWAEGPSEEMSSAGIGTIHCRCGRVCTYFSWNQKKAWCWYVDRYSLIELIKIFLRTKIFAEKRFNVFPFDLSPAPDPKPQGLPASAKAISHHQPKQLDQELCCKLFQITGFCWLVGWLVCLGILCVYVRMALIRGLIFSLLSTYIKLTTFSRPT